MSGATLRITWPCGPTAPGGRYFLDFCAAFGKRAALIHDRMSRIPGLVVPRPTGAFYAFPDISAHFGKKSPEGVAVVSSQSFCEALLNEAKVAAVPGEDFALTALPLSIDGQRPRIAHGAPRLGADNAALGIGPVR